ncbi:MAG: hypothetical protein Q8906_05395 [Bacillota bacterium]|nr:hypothetical protein [Bacillota bacterium]
MDVLEQVRILVRQAVEQYIKSQSEKSTKPPIAILLEYQSLEPKEVLKEISELDAAYNVTLLLGKSWLPLPDELAGMAHLSVEEISQEALNGLVERTAILIFPTSSFQLLAKLALTIDDSLPVQLAIQFQLAGKPIVIANNEAELDVSQQIFAPHTVQERLQSYIRQLQADQVKWVPLSKLSETLANVYAGSKSKQTFILARHIETAQRAGLEEIIVPEKSKLSPGGKEMAKQLNIQIKKRES